MKVKLGNTEQELIGNYNYRVTQNTIKEPQSIAEPEPEAVSEPEPEDEYPKRIGALKTRQHGVTGVVHILDDKRIKIEKFAYDGKLI